MIKVYTADNVLEVGLMRSLLAQYDIDSELRNHHASSLLGEVAYTSTWPELWVGSDFAQQAKDIIDNAKKPNEGGSDWFCSACKETNPSNFDLCWSCGASREAAAV